MRKLLSCSLLILLAACSAQHKITDTEKVKDSIIVNGKLFTAFYQQQAAEYDALCYQAYNIARLRLDQALLQPSVKPMAIITDIDETVLNNSPYAVHQALLGKDYDSHSWNEWTSLSAADTLAGTAGFFNYAASKNVETFYVTNRGEKERDATIKNLQRYGFPYADTLHLIMRKTTSSKETRRQAIATTHTIILLLGDVLADFSDLFDNKSVGERLQNTQQSADKFGKLFIVLPNPNYGDWETSQYKYDYKLTAAQKDSVLKSVVKSYSK